jgi:hypothetical protein
VSWPAVAQAVRPTARAVTWGPLLGVATGLVLMAGTARLVAGSDGTAGPVPMLATGLVAAATLEGLHDPAGRLLAAVPVSTFVRALIRITLTLAPAAVALLALSAILPGRTTPMLLPGLALVLSGLGVATWSPPEHEIHLAASIPVLWVLLHLASRAAFSVGDGPLAWWHTDPLLVGAAALCLVVLGSRR